MELQTILDTIANFGFPIACVVAMGAFIWHIFNKTTAQNAENMKRVQDRCKEREEILYKEIAENRAVNAQAIETIAHYAEKLE
jgi:hypothetical protein